MTPSFYPLVTVAMLVWCQKIIRTDHSRKYDSNASPVRYHSNRGTSEGETAFCNGQQTITSSLRKPAHICCHELFVVHYYYDSTRNGFWATRSGWSNSVYFPFLPKICCVIEKMTSGSYYSSRNDFSIKITHIKNVGRYRIRILCLRDIIATSPAWTNRWSSPVEWATPLLMGFDWPKGRRDHLEALDWNPWQRTIERDEEGHQWNEWEDEWGQGYYFFLKWSLFFFNFGEWDSKTNEVPKRQYSFYRFPFTGAQVEKVKVLAIGSTVITG